MSVFSLLLCKIVFENLSLYTPASIVCEFRKRLQRTENVSRAKEVDCPSDRNTVMQFYLAADVIPTSPASRI